MDAPPRKLGFDIPPTGKDSGFDGGRSRDILGVQQILELIRGVPPAGPDRRLGRLSSYRKSPPENEAVPNEARRRKARWDQIKVCPSLPITREGGFNPGRRKKWVDDPVDEAVESEFGPEVQLTEPQNYRIRKPTERQNYRIQKMMRTRFVAVGTVRVSYLRPDESACCPQRTKIIQWLPWVKLLLAAVREDTLERFRRAIRRVLLEQRASSLAVLALLAGLLKADGPDFEDRAPVLPTHRVLAPGGKTSLFPPLN